jgi:hypothetical protein
LEIFNWDWRTYPVLLPLGIALLLGAFYGFWRGLKHKQLWTWSLILYLAGHLAVPHKEGRFMIPIQTLLLWTAFVGWGEILSTLKKRKIRIHFFLKPILYVSLFANGFLFLHALRADLWKAQGIYRELGSHLTANSRICAVLAAREGSSIMMPFDDPTQAPKPAYGALQFGKDREEFSELRNSGISWIEHGPPCQENDLDRVLLHVHRINEEWVAEGGCTLIPSGPLRFLPKTTQQWVLEQGYKAATWYNCPSSIFKFFGEQKVEHLFSHQFNRIENLPRIGTTAKQLEDLGHLTSPPPADVDMPTLAHPLGEKLGRTSGA